MDRKTIVIALGGNAITREFEEGNIYQQFANTRRSLVGVVALIEQGWRVVLTHGNGPQVGNALIRVEATRHLAPPLPLGVIVADLQGGMGYMIQQSLQNMLHRRGIQKEVVTLITQVVVRPDDPSIKNPTKFVGPVYPQEKVEELRHLYGWILKEDRGRGWRRVVPSPEPVEIVEKHIINELVANDRIVIAAGGGGIPVYLDREERLEGINAVIDKDLSAAILARDIGADELVILTAVEKVAIDFAKPSQRWLDHMTIAEAKQYLAEGQFPAGSMGPKIRGAINFLESGGQRAMITSIEMLAAAMQGKTGTVIELSA
ncbi:MAG: carbamate kinase [candidate division KSB1 bacterium]|nr:carbamate kinase [candidate division KSB1 bacterium]MDZ7301830.1 carbamate kinase [candidate division KSB1 bacterium]MDZ7310213.1 carbamate kinase [candidate division KSB1 bacterium]